MKNDWREVIKGRMTGQIDLASLILERIKCRNLHYKKYAKLVKRKAG